MSDADEKCAMEIYQEGRRCKHPCVPGTDYCRQHQREAAPTEEDRLAVLRILAAPDIFSLPPFEICHRIQPPLTGDGRTREHREWSLRTLTLIRAQLELNDQKLIYEAVPADGVHPYELGITDEGQKFLTLADTKSLR